jgi:putative transcriptional regulator
MDNFDLTNQFLIAMPTMADPNFSKTVTYICLHNEDGALGIVINKPMTVELSEVFSQMEIACELSDASTQKIFDGGPVHQDRGFILHQPAMDWDSTIRVTPNIAVSTSRDVLEAIAAGRGPQECLVALGYAGWGAGQLEYEMGENAWLSGPANSDIIFTLPAKDRWHAAAMAMGVDIDALSGDIGHA